MKKGQFTIEFVVVLALLLIVLSTISIPLYNRSRATTEQTKVIMEARTAANRLASGIDSVYSGGNGTTSRASYWLPGEVTKIEGSPVDNELAVELTLDLEDTESVRVDTLLPPNWNSRVELASIETPDHRSYHETILRITENEESSKGEFIISFEDKIKSGE